MRLILFGSIALIHAIHGHDDYDQAVDEARIEPNPLSRPNSNSSNGSILDDSSPSTTLIEYHLPSRLSDPINSTSWNGSIVEDSSPSSNSIESHRPSRLNFPISPHLNHLNSISSNGSIVDYGSSPPSTQIESHRPSRLSFHASSRYNSTSVAESSSSIDYITMAPVTKRPLGRDEFSHIYFCNIQCQIQCEERDSMQTGVFYICEKPIERPRPTLIGFAKEDPVHTCCFLLFAAFWSMMFAYGSWKLYNFVIVYIMWKEILRLRLDILMMLQEKEQRERDAEYAKKMDEEGRLRGDGPLSIFWHLHGYVLKEKPVYPPTPPHRCKSMSAVHVGKEIPFVSPIPLRRSSSLDTVLPSYKLTYLSPSRSLPLLHASHSFKSSLNLNQYLSFHSLTTISASSDLHCNLDWAHLEGGVAYSHSSIYVSVSSLPV